MRTLFLFMTAMPLFAFGEPGSNKQTPILRCPVCNKPAKKNIILTYRQGKIYFATAKHRAKFSTENPTHTTRANLQLVVTGQARQIACPVTGEEIRPNRELTIATVRIKFCCGGCVARVARAEKEIQLYYVFGNNAFRRGFKLK